MSFLSILFLNFNGFLAFVKISDNSRQNNARRYTWFRFGWIFIFFLWFLADDIFLLNNFMFGAEVVVQIELIGADMFQKILLNEHFIQILNAIAEQLNQGIGTILSSSLNLTPPVWSTSYISKRMSALYLRDPLIINSKDAKNY